MNNELENVLERSRDIVKNIQLPTDLQVEYDVCEDEFVEVRFYTNFKESKVNVKDEMNKFDKKYYSFIDNLLKVFKETFTDYEVGDTGIDDDGGNSKPGIRMSIVICIPEFNED